VWIKAVNTTQPL